MTLDALPLDVLCVIASFTNEQTIWATMATCKTLREAGERALMPYLRAKVVQSEPSFLIDRFTAIGPYSASSNPGVRCDRLKLVNLYFTKHLDAYPKSAELLRSLTLEVSCHENYDEGWEQLGRFLPQLKTLDLRIVEPKSWFICNNCEYPFGRIHKADPRDRDTINRMYGDWENVILDRIFPELVQLSIHTGVRALEHLDVLAASIPHLRQLTLGSHWGVGDINGNHGTLQNISTLTELESITLIGGEQMVKHALEALSSSSKALRQVVVHILDSKQIEVRDIRESPTLPPMKDRPQIASLALYGHRAFHFFLSNMLIPSSPYDASFHHITVLVLERSERVDGHDGHSGDEYASNEEGIELLDSYDPLLDNVTYIRPELPCLQRIIWAGISSKRIYDPDNHSEFFHTDSLLALFEHYVTLSDVHWVSDYPSNPFNPDDPNLWEERIVQCTVYRPTPGPNGALSELEPIRPSLVNQDRTNLS